MSALTVAVLGTLEVRLDGVPVQVAGPLPRRLLALLAARPGRDVPVDTLIDGLWAEDPPAAAKATLQSHVARLRGALRLPEVIVAGPSAYRLAVGQLEVDAGTFTAAAERGRRLLAAAGDTDAAEAAAVLRAGLDLWRGSAYAEFAGCRPLEAESARLELLRLDALQWRISAELRLGAASAPIAELEALLREHPTREPLWALLMRALYRSGRQADALEAYRRARRVLVDELGIEPGRELRETERLILTQDPALEPGTPALGPAAAWRAAPASEPELAAVRPEPPPRSAQPGGSGQPPAQAGATSNEAATSRPARERRTVTILVADRAADPSLDPEDFAARSSRLREMLTEVSARYGGAVHAELGGTLVAVFGAPVAHDDDAIRALRAADALVASCGRQVPVRAALATGEVVLTAGAASPWLSGAPLETATGLRALADGGEIVLDDSTRRLADDYLEVAALQAGSVAGPWRLKALRAVARAAPVPLTPLVGRSRDLALLRALYDKAADELSAQLVTVVAEAGEGKSRLVAEFARSLEASGAGAVVRRGRCLAYGDDTALTALSEMVMAHAGITHADTAAAVRGKIRAVLPADERDQLEPRLAPLLGVDAGVTPSRAESFAAWRRFIEIMAASQPAVLLVEDMHWAAPLLADFVGELVAGADGVPLLVVVTARPELFDRLPGWGSGPLRSTILRLAPLTEQETGEIFDALLGDASPADQKDRSALIDRCGGVPLYAEEIARLAIADPSWARAQIPPALSAVIAARLDTIAPAHRLLLTTAAVAGPTFWPVQLAALSGSDPSHLAPVLEALVRREFVRRLRSSRRPGETEYAFAHELVREAAYARLPRADRARIHLATAHWWESSASERPDEVADLIAHHAGTAHDLAVALADHPLAEQARVTACRALTSAGERLQGLDTGGSLRLLRRALELADPDSPEQARILVWLGTATADDRQFAAAEILLERALDLLERANDPLRVDAALFALNTKFALGHDFAPCDDSLGRAVIELPPSRAAVRALGARAMFRLLSQTQESLQAAIDRADEAIAMAAEHDTGGEAFAHVVRGRARLGRGDGAGLAELERWLAEVVRHESGTLGVGATQWLAGALHHWRGPAAEWQVRQGLEALAAARGLQFITSMGVAEDVRVLYELGRLREAVALADAIGPTPDAQPRWAVVQRALALADLGELDGDTIAAVIATPPADEGDLRHVLGSALVHAAAALAQDQQAVAAAALCTLGDMRRFRDRDGAMELLPRLVRTAAAAGVPELVADLHGIDAVATPLRSHISATVDGLLAAQAADHERAVPMLRQALRGWTGFGCRLEAAGPRSISREAWPSRATRRLARC